jgi:hypothetical protein
MKLGVVAVDSMVLICSVLTARRAIARSIFLSVISSSVVWHKLLLCSTGGYVGGVGIGVLLVIFFDSGFAPTSKFLELCSCEDNAECAVRDGLPYFVR